MFVNPTREDNFPTVNIEALACGTPVLTYNIGGSPEIIDETCGAVVAVNNIPVLEEEIKQICVFKRYPAENCIKRAMQFDMYDKYSEYVELYRKG